MLAQHRLKWRRNVMRFNNAKVGEKFLLATRLELLADNNICAAGAHMSASDRVMADGMTQTSLSRSRASDRAAVSVARPLG
jgi:hypothetical protein